MQQVIASGTDELRDDDHDVSDWFHAEIMPFRACRWRRKGGFAG